MRRHGDGAGERDRRVDPVADDMPTSIRARRCARAANQSTYSGRRLLAESRAASRASRRARSPRAVRGRAPSPRCAAASAGLQLLGVVVQALGEALRQRCSGFAARRARDRAPPPPPAARHRRVGLGSDAVAAVGMLARAHRPAGAPARGRPRRRRPALRRRARWCQPSAGSMRAARSASISAPRPSRRRRRGPRSGAEAARAAPRPAASAPSSQRRSSAVSWPRQQRREGGVGGVEEMMALVEHIAGRHRGADRRACRRARPGSYQGVVGDRRSRPAAPAGRCCSMKHLW